MHILHILIFVASSGVIGESLCDFVLKMPNVTTVAEGEDAELLCKMTDYLGSVPPCRSNNYTFKWLANNSQIASCESPRVTNGYKFDDRTGTLRILSVDTSMDGLKITCQAFNGIDFKHKETVLSVFRTRKRTVVEGEDVTLECGAALANTTNGSLCHADFVVEWRANASILVSCDVPLGNYSTMLIEQTGAITIPNVSVDLNGTYLTCSFITPEQTTTSLHTKLIVYHVLAKSVYIINGATGDILIGNVSVRSDTNLTFICLATNTKPAADITWSLDGQDISGETSVTEEGPFNMSSTIMVPSFETWKQMILTCTVSLMGMNVSTTIRLRPNGTDVIREFSTTQPPWSYGQVPTSTWKTSNHANTVRIPWSAWISVGVAVLAALVLVLIIATVLLKRQKRVSSGEANREGSLFRRSSIERTSVSMSPVLSTATQASGSRLLETAAAVNPRDQNNVPSSSRKKPNSIGSEVALVYADLEHTRTHPAGAPPIRAECPTNYAEINLSLLSSSVNLPFASSSQDEAPPRPLRGNPIPLLPRHLHL